jgi:hypothetical protein
LKQKYGGMEASDVKRLKDLDLENSRLKCLLADTILDKEILKDVIEKKAGARRASGTCYDDLEALSLIRSYADDVMLPNYEPGIVCC